MEILKNSLYKIKIEKVLSKKEENYTYGGLCYTEISYIIILKCHNEFYGLEYSEEIGGFVSRRYMEENRLIFIKDINDYLRRCKHYKENIPIEKEVRHSSIKEIPCNLLINKGFVYDLDKEQLVTFNRANFKKK